MTRISRPLAAVLASLLLAVGCDAFSATSASGEDACKRYAVQFEAIKKIEAERTIATLGGNVRPEELVASPTNIARAAREIEPRCEALSKQDRACVERVVPVIASYLEARAACDDQPCKTAAGEAAKTKVTDDCIKVTQGLDCVQTEDCKGRLGNRGALRSP